MEITFNNSLFRAINPKTLRDFWAKVLGQALPPSSVVGEWYEALGLGPKAWYVGTAEQNRRIIQELQNRAGIAFPPR